MWDTSHTLISGKVCALDMEGEVISQWWQGSHLSHTVDDVKGNEAVTGLLLLIYMKGTKLPDILLGFYFTFTSSSKELFPCQDDSN